MDQFIHALKTAPGPYSCRPNPALGRLRRHRLIENLELDAVSLRPAAWAYPEGLPAGRGGNLTAAALAEATARLDGHATARNPDLSFSDLLKLAGAALSPRAAHGGLDFFFRVALPATPLAGTLWNVCPLSSLSYSFKGAGTAWEKALHDWLTSPDPKSLPVQPDRGRISLGAASFWLSDESPLDLLAARGLAPGTQEAALAVLRELALPGYETRTRRREARGLVAVEFTAADLQDLRGSAQAWKPTAIDALNYKGYCFLPGRAGDPHGVTWPLGNRLIRHENRDGLREFVHPRIEAPALTGGRRRVHLLGFLDADAETAWHSLAAP